MKKILAVILVICMLATALAACGNKDNSGADGSSDTESTASDTQSGDTDSSDEGLSDDDSRGLDYALNKDGLGYTVIGIGEYADAELVIPDTYKGLPVTGIGRVAFRYNGSITSVKIGNNVTSIGFEAFRECDRLTFLTIGDGVTTINSSAFYGCGGLTSITIGNSVTDVSSSAFNACGKLVEVINNSSLSVTAGSTDNGYVAYSAKEIHSGPSKMVNENGYIFYTYEGVDYLIGYVGSDRELTLPESYNGRSYKIYDRAFYNYAELKSVTIPESITDISGEAFFGCSNIETAAVHVRAIFCIPKDSLRTVVITGGTRMDDFVLCDCACLENVTIDSSITRIGEWAFSGCIKLTGIAYNGTVEQWKAIDKGYGWNSKTDLYTVTCTDGVLKKSES